MIRWKSLHEQIKCRWREFVREPSAFFFVTFMPVLWMCILGGAFSGDPQTEIHLGWYAATEQDQDTHSLIYQGLAEAENIHVVRGDQNHIMQLLKHGKIALAIRSSESNLTYQMDRHNKEALYAVEVVDQVIQTTLGRQDVIAVNREELALPGTRYVDFLVPGLIALSIMTSSLFGTGMIIVANRRENLLKRYLATPMQPVTYILSHIVGRTMILLVEFSVVLLAAVLIFDFQVQGSIINLFLFSALGAAAFTALAVACASRTSNSFAMNGITNLVSLPLMIISGVWFSRSHFPEWLDQIASYLPLAPLVDGLRKIALEGVSLAGLASESFVLTAYTIVGVIAAKLLFKWY